MDDNERISVLTALLVVAFSVAAFVSFFVAGSGVLFWISAIIAVVAGFYMAFRISNESKQAGYKKKHKGS